MPNHEGQRRSNRHSIMSHEDKENEALNRRASVTAQVLRENNVPLVFFRMPNTAFGISLGLAAQAKLWQVIASSKHLGNQVDSSPNWILWVLALASGSIILVLYLYKAIKYPFLVKAEWDHPVRVHFFNLLNLLLIKLAIGVPHSLQADDIAEKVALRIIFGVALAIQMISTNPLYIRWLFDSSSSVTMARPQFLLSCMGWFFLSGLGSKAGITEYWNIAIPEFCWGAGIVLYLIVLTSNFISLSQSPTVKETPAMFLFLDPPSIAATSAMHFFNGEFGLLSQYLLGWCLLLCVMMIRLVPTVQATPQSLGINWTYVFSIADVAVAAVHYADYQTSLATCILAYLIAGLSLGALFLVFLREAYHFVQAFQGKADLYPDPVVMDNLNHFSCDHPRSPEEREEKGHTDSWLTY